MPSDKIKIFFLAGLSAILLTASFPDVELWWLAWIALVPLMSALKNLSVRQAFLVGFFSGVVHYLTLMYWLVHTLTTYGNLPFYLSFPVFFLLAAYLALYHAVFGAAFSWISTKPSGFMALLPGAWVSLEYIRSFFLSGFPWEFLGYSQYQNLILIQIADITGVYGLSFLIVAVNTALFMLRNQGQEKHSSSGNQLRFAISCTTILLVIHVLAYGQWRMDYIDSKAAASDSSKIAVVQGNIDQTIKWNPEFQIATIEKYLSLSMSAKTLGPELIVWPETSAPFYFMSNVIATRMVIKGVMETGTDVLIGSPSITRIDENRTDYFNSAFLIGADGNVKGKYDKAHLVPFGEYVPFQKWLPFIGKLVEGVGDFVPGKKGLTLAWDKHRIGIQICYEMIFPGLSREMVLNNAALLINMTNDAWYGRTSAPYQHFSMAVFRAVENRRSVVRSANTGISGFIDPNGRIMASTPLFEDAVLAGGLPILAVESFYTRYGDVFSMACLGITVIAFFLLAVRKKRACRYID